MSVQVKEVSIVSANLTECTLLIGGPQTDIKLKNAAGQIFSLPNMKPADLIGMKASDGDRGTDQISFRRTSGDLFEVEFHEGSQIIWKGAFLRSDIVIGY